MCLAIMKKIIQFFKNHPIIKTLLLITITSILLIFITFWGLSIYTQHGKAVLVPDVIGMAEKDALRTLENQGFRCEVYDSIFVDNGIPGSIIEQVPAENSKVKSGRKIFLKIIAYSPRKIICPQVEGSPSRQARASLESAGFKKINIKEVDAEFDDLVMGVEVNGTRVEPGEAVLYNQTITLLVGKSAESKLEEESLMEDSGSSKSSSDEDWFL